ncbi:sulfatase family protein [Carboxylicivirga sp. RSCT41]|uniref:sulfatase family protein n=1 Tax=Carboxylicivirga agarovorans TaxID=3417570 RepID=UPI003D32C57A
MIQKYNYQINSIILILFLSACGYYETAEQNENPLNIVLITLDDMGYGTTGVEGCSVPGITPYIDRFASEGITFTHGFVMSPMCGPSRAAILSGRYPHCSGMMGHGKQPPVLWEEPAVKTPTISTYLHDHGYTTGAILKLSRSKYMNTWDTEYHEFPFGVGFHDRNPKSFYTRTKEFINSATKSNKPFFLYANPIDPHRPWDNTEQEKAMLAQWNPDKKYPEPSRKYSTEEIEVPEFLLDLPDVREALVPYYNALNRGDECVGSILQAIDDSEMRDNTLVIFLSDHGMGAPGAKNTLYHDGIRTPIIMRWPKKIKEGVMDDKSIVSVVDLVPTILDAAGLPSLEAIEGKSFIDVILGKSARTERAYAYASSNYKSNSTQEEFFPHRAIIDESFCYIFNAYVVRTDGKKKKASGWMDVVNSSLTKSEKLKNKIEYMEYRAPEELFDLKNDPGCWNNLAQNSDYADQIKEYRKKLLKEMKETADPELSVFDDFISQ